MIIFSQKLSEFTSPTPASVHITSNIFIFKEAGNYQFRRASFTKLGKVKRRYLFWHSRGNSPEK